MKKTSKISTFIYSLVVLLIVVAFIGFLFFRTDNFTTGLKNFYVSCNDENFMGNQLNYNVTIGKTYNFEIHNSTDDLFDNEGVYYVQVIPNESYDFVFTCDNVKKNFKDVDSLSEYFYIDCADNFFTFKADDTELSEMFSKYYSTDNIQDCPIAIDSGKAYFCLSISNNNGDSIKINFNLRK